MNPEYKKIELEETINRLHINKTFLVQLIQKFLNSNMLKEAEEKFKINDIEGARIAIHSIKGTSANVGLSGISKLALDIENKIKENAYLDFELIELMKILWGELLETEF